MEVHFSCSVGQDDVWHKIDHMMRERDLRGGVYRVHAIDPDAPPDSGPSHLTPIPRILGNDPLGRLYIGKADTLTDRFITLLKALSPKHNSRDGHGFGRGYFASTAIQARFPRLWFTLRFHENPRDCERDELLQYQKEFGEPPPFNSMP